MMPKASNGKEYTPLVVDRANTSSTRGGCQRQALVFDAKREYTTHRQGGAKCAPSRHHFFKGSQKKTLKKLNVESDFFRSN